LAKTGKKTGVREDGKVPVRKAYRYRIYPTAEQAFYLRRAIGASRFAYNALVRLARWRRWHRKLTAWGVELEPDIALKEEPVCSCGHTRLAHAKAKKQEDGDKVPRNAPRGECGAKDAEGCACLCKAMQAVSGRHVHMDSYSVIAMLGDTPGTEFLREVNSQILNCSAAGPYDQAWQNWRARPDHFKPPTNKRRRLTRGSFIFQDAKVDGSYLVLKGSREYKLADPRVKMRVHRKMRGVVKSGGVQLIAGHWYATVLCEWYADAPVHKHPGTAVGVDMNVANLLATSDGRIEPGVAKELDRLDKIVRRRQRAARNKQRGSRNWKKAQMRIAKTQARAARIRDDALNKVAHELASTYETVCIEDLRVKNMLASAAGTVESPGQRVKQKRGLNRAIARQGWRALRTKLEVKAAMYGGRVAPVPPMHTSRTCAACGCVDAQSRYTQAGFCCVACGHTDHADVNASRNIRERGLALLASPDGPSGPARGGAPDAEPTGLAGAPAKREATVARPKHGSRQDSTRCLITGTSSDATREVVPVLAPEMPKRNKEMQRVTRGRRAKRASGTRGARASPRRPP